MVNAADTGVAVSMAATLFGLAQAAAGWWEVRSFAAGSAADADAPAGLLPAVTLLKPLCGEEPGIEQALASFCAQDYPRLQIVFGVRDPADPAASVARRLQRLHPAVDIAVVADPREHGANRKISNLINMLPAARHDILVFADSDLHVPADYLRRVVAALLRPGCGLVTTLTTGRPGSTCLAARLGALAVTCLFLPGVLLARRLGRQDNLGTTMALRRTTLAAAGGLEALAGELADDAALGRRVRRLGLDIGLATTVPQTTVAETGLRALFAHELRWGRTIRALVPTAYALSLLQYPLFWAALAVPLSGGAAWSVAAFALAWGGRALLAIGVCASLRRIGMPQRPALRLLPLRDVFSAAVVLCSFAGRAVTWRGHVLHAAGPRLSPDAVAGKADATKTWGLIR
jgi:ceramide glucosyltransferase